MLTVLEKIAGWEALHVIQRIKISIPKTEEEELPAYTQAVSATAAEILGKKKGNTAKESQTKQHRQHNSLAEQGNKSLIQSISHEELVQTRLRTSSP